MPPKKAAGRKGEPKAAPAEFFSRAEVAQFQADEAEVTGRFLANFQAPASPVERAPPTVRFPKKKKTARELEAEEEVKRPSSPGLRHSMALLPPPPGEGMPLPEYLNTSLAAWLASTAGTHVAAHAPMLPLEFFDEFDTFEHEDTDAPERVAALAALQNEQSVSAVVFDTQPPQRVVRSLALNPGTSPGDGYGRNLSESLAACAGVWRPALVKAIEADGTFVVAWLDVDSSDKGYDGNEGDEASSARVASLNVCFDQGAVSGNSSGVAATGVDYCGRIMARLCAALTRRRHAESLVRYHLYVDCVPINARTVAPLEAPQLAALVERAANVPGPMGGRKLTNFPALVSELQGECRDGHTACMNGVAFQANAAGHRGVLMDLALPPEPPPVKPPRKGTIADLPVEYTGKAEAEAKFRAKAAVTNATVLKVMREVRKMNLDASSQRVLFTGPAPSPPKGGRKGAAIFQAMDFEKLDGEDLLDPEEYKEEEDREMDGGVWTFDGFVAQQASTTKKAGIRTLREDWPHDVGAGVFEALQEQAVNEPESGYNVLEAKMDAYLGEAGSRLRAFLTRVTLEMTDVCRDTVKASLDEYVAMLAIPAKATVEVKGRDEVVVTAPEEEEEEGASASPPASSIKPPQPVLGLRLRVSRLPQVLNGDAIAEVQKDIDAWHQARQVKRDKGQPVNENEVCPTDAVPPVMGLVFEYSTDPAKYVEACLAAFDAAVESLQGMFAVPRFVMQRLFFPRPQQVHTPTLDTPWVASRREELKKALEDTLSAPKSFLATLDEWSGFLNQDVDAYVSSLDFKLSGGDGDDDGDGDDHDSAGGEGVTRVDVRKLDKVLAMHKQQRAQVLDELKADPLSLGLWAVDCTPVRDALAEKHTQVIERLLVQHAAAAAKMAHFIDESYVALEGRLAEEPEDIEHTVALEEFLSHVKDQTEPLEELITECDEYTTAILDPFCFQVGMDQSAARFMAQGWPFKVKSCIEAAALRCERRREQFAEQLTTEQEAFVRLAAALEADVNEFGNFEDLAQVTEAAAVGAALANRLKEAEDSVALFNSREGLFEREYSEYDSLTNARKTFEPFNNLWKSAAEWQTQSTAWMHGPWNEIDAELCETVVDNTFQTITKTAKFFGQGANKSDKQAAVALHVQSEVKDFRPLVPLLLALRNQGMAQRHWDQIEEATGVSIGDVTAPDFTLQKVVNLGLDKHLEVCEKVAESAAKEYTIQQTLDKMEEDWLPFKLDIRPYRDTGTGVLAGFDEINAVLDEQVTMTQAMQFSAFKGPFEERIERWNTKLFVVSEVLDNWAKVQRDWMYLQPIFESDDIIKQLPKEAKKYASVDKAWRQSISAAKKNPKVVDFCDNEKLLERFREGVMYLDQVQKGLNQYLETKRDVFPRFYFLSNDDLLTILSESKDVLKLNPHLKKVFEAVDHATFSEDLIITNIVSPEKEAIELTRPLDPKGSNVESWLMALEIESQESIRDIMKLALADYPEAKRTDWMQKWPSMHVLNGSQLYWTKETEVFFREHGAKAPQLALDQQKLQLADMVVLVRQPLSKGVKTKVGALAVIDVHARDVMVKLVAAHTSSLNDFLWQSQLRYYWEKEGSEHGDDGDLWAMMVAARRPYCYEYLGNSFRLVITPLTDKCYLTLMGALQLVMGGAPAGPAGTGKTETTKDLSKALAVQCVVFNCSDGLGYLEMAKFAKGLSSCGAWACYDEFNRINIEVLSVVGQQVMEIQLAIKAGLKRIIFSDSDIAVKPGFGVFITMNPGYAGRTELPDSLAALFRPVAMMVPDYALIGEIMFFAYGFGIARECGNKMVGTFKLCSEQCSSQPHYDYGMRAVKTVIVAAGNLKSAEPDADEISLIMRALVDVNTPKFLDQDIPLYAGIMGDLFPGISKPVIDYGKLFASMKAIMAKKNLQPHPWFIEKVIQLYEMIVVRHGLMLVGPTGGGKTMNVEVLQETLGDLKRQKVKGFAYEKVIVYQLNPKSITMGQMYGAFDPNTREWQDGIMSTMYRLASMSQSSDRKWMMFNGPVDAIWIENMNTVLDDNKKLCLNSGEIMKMSEEMTMMFEVEDLQVASPATVSRVGIIYMEPSALGIDVLVQSWLNTLPLALKSRIQARLVFLMDSYLRPAINFVRDHLKELSPTVDNNLASSLMRLLDCYFAPFVFVEGKPPPKQEIIDTVVQGIDELFTFCLVWSVGATTNDEGRLRFDAFLRQEMCFNGMQKVRPPTTGDLYAFMYDSEAGKWVKWMDTTDPYAFAPGKLNFSEIVIPTTDSVRNTYLLDMLVSNAQHTLMVGETGTGKTVNISQFLQGQSKSRGKVIDPSIVALTMTFSATASANMTQDLLDSKFEKRKRGVFGPAAGKKYAIHVDDMNMPLREEYGAQPPIEILRQWFDQAGWYDRKELTFRNIVDITFVGSMGPPGGGRQIVTGRFLRHFNTIGYVEMSDESKATIFGTIVNEWLSSFPNNPGAFMPLGDAMVKATLYTFTKVVAELLPTPAKCHYIFNLRDLSKVFQGVLMGEPKLMTVPEELARLWVHESVRVFEDRMVDEHDHNWFQELMAQNIDEYFKLNWADVRPRERLLYGDFMVPGADPRVYAEIPDMDQLKHTVEDYLAEHNAESKQPMPLVMFNDALMHVGRIARVIRQPQGNALLLGVGGSGRQSMTRLATYISGYNIFSVNITKGYGQVEWREDVKQCLLYAGLQDKPIVFLFSDAQVVMESMVEDINNVLNAGDVPNLYVAEDEDKIVSACRVECQRKRIPPTKLNIFAQYLIRVRRNLHVCFCMSPLGEAFRDRMRNFPSIVNCCTADWFTLWPRDALISVGRATLDTAEMQEQLGETLEPMVDMFGSIHLSVEDASRNFFESLRRRNYVTPTSYLELLSSFKSLLGMKFSQVNTKRDRLQVGLDKLSSTKEVVATLQKEIEALEPVLVVKSKEVSEMMVVITADKADAEVTKAACEVQEADANEKAAATKEIADSAQADLDKALPALAASLKALDSLKKSDIDEVKSLGKPPAGVRLTMEVCCGFFEIKADMVKDPDSGKKVPDYFGTAKKTLLSDAKAFMDMMVKFDKDNIKDSVIQKIEPFMENPDFTPDQIKKASVACTAICMWAHAMHTYHYVALGVAPKKAKLAEAQATLDVVLSALAQAKGKLATVIAKVDALEKQFNEAVAEKQALEQKAEQCQVRLSNAGKLIGGLGGEEARWKETVANLNVTLRCVPGDVAVSAGSVSYLGPFTAEFRSSITDGWVKRLAELKIPNTDGCDIVQTLADPVKLRKWQLCGLPTDPLSTQNGIMIDSSRRWPLVIDPQGQCNSYVRRMGKNKDMSANGLDVVKLSEKNFLRSLENGVRFGKWVLLENVYETLDASLEPILMQQIFKQGGQDVIKIGDNVIPYSDTFRFFMTTKMANPHYPPETQVKVSIVNFTVTESGLEDQLLDLCVLEELPDLAEKKAELVVQNAQMNGQLFDIESQILVLLAESKGNILDDTVLIETLSQAKATSEEVKAKMIEAEETGKEIYERSEEYRPVAFLASLLYFCISQLGYVDPMYQYSLPWFCTLFAKGIGEAKPAQDIEARCQSIIDYFTYMLYCNVCRSLFEQHKLMFSFLLCIKILQGRDKVDPNEWRFLISGMSLGKKDMPNPDPSWIESNVWDEVCNLTGGMPFFEGLADSFKARTKEWKAIFDDNNPHKRVFPKPFDTLRMDDPVGGLRCLCIIRCLRLDKTMACVETFVLSQEFLGTKFVEPPPINLKECFNDSSVIMPLIFILSTGSDPNKDIQTLAETMGCTDSLKSIALGQGQDKLAEAMVTKGMEKGDWVVLQNCHLFVSWMPVLEAMCEEMDPSTINPDFRLWLTSKPSPAFPLTILQNGVKMTKEPPKGLRANLRSMYIKLTDSDIVCTSKPVEFSRLLFSLSFFHAVMLERKRFGPLGWNIPYAFNDTDVDICISQLKLYVDKYDEIPYSVLQLLTSMVNYGGRITDDKDMRTSDIIVGSLLAPQVLEDNFAFSESGIYKTLVAEMDAPLASYLAYIDSLPLNAEPEVFGMHSNAAITCDINEAVDVFGIITSLQPRTSSGGGMSREDQIGLIAKELEVQMFPPWDEEKVKLQYPIDYNESMNTILGQEIAKYNLVIRTVNLSLKMLQLALKGLVVLSAELENMGNSLFNQAVPSNWEKVAYPSLKPLKPWFADFLARTRSATTQGFIGKWVNEGLPSAYWVSGFFFPQGFLTAIQQNYARQMKMPIDTVGFGYKFTEESPEALLKKPKPKAGAYTYGLFFEGARWDSAKHVITDPRPKELFSPMPAVLNDPIQNRPITTEGIYRCPVYKILSRRGVLSTTGHSTNFVLWLEVPSDKPRCFRSSLVSETNSQVMFCDNEYWVKGGVAAFCSLRY